jgi:mono/diheme cytochrome c family protein
LQRIGALPLFELSSPNLMAGARGLPIATRVPARASLTKVNAWRMEILIVDASCDDSIRSNQVKRLLTTSIGLGIALILAAPALADVASTPSNQVEIGETTYRTYCALCHGIGGAPGMFSEALNKAAPNLTEIAKRNGGQFPDVKVEQIIRDGGISGHGTMRLLSWERYFRTDTSEEQVDQVIHDLIEYLKNHQIP